MHQLVENSQSELFALCVLLLTSWVLTFLELWYFLPPGVFPILTFPGLTSFCDYCPELQALAMVIFSSSILLLFICVVSLQQSIWAFPSYLGLQAVCALLPQSRYQRTAWEREAGEEVLTERPICSQELKNEIGLNGEIEQVVNFDGARKFPAPLPPSQLDTQVAQQNHNCQIIGHLIFSKSNLFVFSKNTY